MPVLADFRPHRFPDFLQYTTQILHAEVGVFFDQTNEFSYLHTVKSFQLIERVYNYVGCLKVPKREIFVTELFILSDPIWVGNLRTKPKKLFV